MDAPPVHAFIHRSGEIGRRLGPVALAAAFGGFAVWLAALHRAPGLAAAGWLLGAAGVVLGLVASLASGIGLLAQERRDGAARGLLTGALAIVVPTLLAILVLIALASSWHTAA